MWCNRPTTGRNYSGEQKVKFESPVPFSESLRTTIYSNMNVYLNPKGCQTLLLKESESHLFSFGLWTSIKIQQYIDASRIKQDQTFSHK